MTLLSLSWSGGVCIALVLLARALAKKQVPTRFFCAAWTLCALRLLLPLEIPCRLSIWALLRPERAVSIVQNRPAATALSPAASHVSVAVDAPVSRLSPAVSLTALWVLGAALLAALFLFGHLRIRRAFRAAEPAQDTAQWLQAFGLRFRRNLSIRFLDDARAPLTYGIGHPVVVLPKRLETDAQQRILVLAHELMHVRYFDCLQKCLLSAALCVHWFNPLVWLMVRAANRDMELACDEAALSLLGQERRKDYVRMLLRFAAETCPGMPLGSGFGQTAIEERIESLMKRKKYSVWILLLTVAVLSLSMSVFATQAPAPKPDVSPAASVPAKPVSAAPEQTVKSSPVRETAVPETASEEPAQEAAWVWPCASRSAKVLLAFGPHENARTHKAAMHYGCDLDVASGTEVYASHAGTVSFAGFTPDGGYRIILDHENGFQSVYQHLQSTSVSKGDTVTQGQTIGLSGGSGWVTDPQLHVAMLKDGEYLDPMLFMQR